jgi:hypothetical protein
VEVRGLYLGQPVEAVARNSPASEPAPVSVTAGDPGAPAACAPLDVRQPVVTLEPVETLGAGASLTAAPWRLWRPDVIGGAARQALAGSGRVRRREQK